MDMMLRFLDDLDHFGNTTLKEHIGKKDFFEGLSLMRKGLNAEYTYALANCFMMSACI